LHIKNLKVRERKRRNKMADTFFEGAMKVIFIEEACSRKGLSKVEKKKQIKVIKDCTFTKEQKEKFAEEYIKPILEGDYSLDEMKPTVVVALAGAAAVGAQLVLYRKLTKKCQKLKGALKAKCLIKVYDKTIAEHKRELARLEAGKSKAKEYRKGALRKAIRKLENKKGKLKLSLTKKEVKASRKMRQKGVK